MKRLVAGPRAVLEALRANSRNITVVYAAAGERGELAEVHTAARKASVPFEVRPRSALDALARGLRHQGVLALGGDYPYVHFEQLLADASGKLLVALDQITDPHNFGAIVRSAVAFGAAGVVTLKNRACPVTPVVVRAATGATEHIPIARVVNLARCLSQLREVGLEVVGLDGAGDQNLADLPWSPQGRVLGVGAEGHGLRRLTLKHCDQVARVPIPGPIESLNASVAAGVALYETNRTRGLGHRPI